MATGFFPGSFTEVASHFKIWPDAVRKVWSQVCSKGTVARPRHETGDPAHLKPENVQLVEFLKRNKPSVTNATIKNELERHCDIDGGTSISAIGRTVRKRMSDGQWTRKKLSKQPIDKFTDRNVAYAQRFLEFLHGTPPGKVKFFDEAGVHAGVGHPFYGHSLKGTRAVEIVYGKTKGANYTLNLYVELRVCCTRILLLGEPILLTFQTSVVKLLKIPPQVDYQFLKTAMLLSMIMLQFIVIMVVRQLPASLTTWV